MDNLLAELLGGNDVNTMPHDREKNLLPTHFSGSVEVICDGNRQCLHHNSTHLVPPRFDIHEIVWCMRLTRGWRRRETR